MCKVISIISCKGGVGKTASAVNISSSFNAVYLIGLLCR